MQFCFATISMAALVLSVSSADAQSSSDPPCRYSVQKQIAFTAPAAKDRLKVSIGPGACHSARLYIVVRSAQGRILYRYVAPFKQHVATQWDDPELPQIARQFVDETVLRSLVPKGEFPTPKLDGQAEDGGQRLAVPASVFKRLASSGQPMIYHQTYYEGGQYVVFDPVTRRVRVVVREGI